VFYGFIHQGAVLPLISHLSKELKAKPYLTHVHLVTSHTYPLPTGLLHLRNTRTTYTSDSGHKYMLTKDCYIYELNSSDVQFTFNAIRQISENCDYNWHIKKIPYRLYYALPFSFYNEFKHYTLQHMNNATQIFKFHPVKTFYPHLSIEKPPVLGSFINCLDALHNCLFYFSDNLSDRIVEYFKQFNLLLLRIEHTNKR